MTPFELYEPGSIAEAIGLIDAHDPSVRPIAGGTALMLMMKAGVFRPTRLVSLRRLDGGFGRIALGAKVRAIGPAGERTIAVTDLFAGYFATVLANNELIAEVQVPAQGATRAAYLKVTTGSAEDWPALGVATAIEVEGGMVKSARLVVGSATEKALRLKAAEETLTGAAIDD